MAESSRNGAWSITDTEQLHRFWSGGRFWVPEGSGFRGDVFRRELPQMQLEGIESTPYGCERPVELLDQYPGDLLIVSGMVAGHGWAERGSDRVELAAGDVLIHRRQPLTYECVSDSRTFRVAIDTKLVAETGADGFFPFELVPRSTLSGAFIRFAHEVLRSVAREPVLLTRTQRRLEQALLILLKGVVGELLEREQPNVGSGSLLRLRTEQWIEENLQDPELSADTIAAALGVSRRRLFQVFETESETLTTSIRRRRIEAATDFMELDPTVTVGVLAERFGFPSTDSFTRAFQRHHGSSVRALRAEFAAPTEHAGVGSY